LIQEKSPWAPEREYCRPPGLFHRSCGATSRGAPPGWTPNGDLHSRFRPQRRKSRTRREQSDAATGDPRSGRSPPTCLGPQPPQQSSSRSARRSPGSSPDPSPRVPLRARGKHRAPPSARWWTSARHALRSISASASWCRWRALRARRGARSPTRWTSLGQRSSGATAPPTPSHKGAPCTALGAYSCGRLRRIRTRVAWRCSSDGGGPAVASELVISALRRRRRLRVKSQTHPPRSRPPWRAASPRSSSPLACPGREAPAVACRQRQRFQGPRLPGRCAPVRLAPLRRADDRLAPSRCAL
jgi:hypothetical protein